VIDTSLDYVTTPNCYPLNQKELLGAQEEGQTRSFPSSTGQIRNAWALKQGGHIVPRSRPRLQPLVASQVTLFGGGNNNNWMPN
jgi:hypothetical protein